MKFSCASTLLIGLLAVTTMVTSPVQAYTDVYDCPVGVDFQVYWNRGPNSAEKAIAIELLEHSYDIAHGSSSSDFQTTGASTATNWSSGPLSMFSSWWMTTPNKLNNNKLRASSPNKELRDTSGYTWYGIAVTVSVMLGCNVCNHADDDTLPIMELDAETATTNTLSTTITIPGMLSNSDLEYWEGEFCYQMEDSGYNIYDFTKNCAITFNQALCSTRMATAEEEAKILAKNTEKTKKTLNMINANFDKEAANTVTMAADALKDAANTVTMAADALLAVGEVGSN